MRTEQPFRRSVRGSQAAPVKPHWRPGILSLLLGMLCASNGFAAVADQTNNVPALDYQAFKIINERNIFNSRRYGRSTSSRRESRSATRVESFALTGTMSYEKGPFAF